MSDCEQCKSLYLELERLRRLVPNGTYTLNVAHEEEIQRLRSQLENVLDSHVEGGWQARVLDAERERNAAQAKAVDFERNWYEAKSEFGSAMAKMREALRAAEKRELEALAELDEARAKLGALAKLLVAHGCDCSEMSSNFDCERCFACKASDVLGELV